MTESEIQAEAVKRLRANGWLVVVTSQDRSTRRQLSGLPDVLAWRDNVNLLIECKAPGGVLRASQQAFADDLRPHLGPNVYYLVLYHPAQLPRWAVTEIPS